MAEQLCRIGKQKEAVGKKIADAVNSIGNRHKLIIIVIAAARWH